MEIASLPDLSRLRAGILAALGLAACGPVTPGTTTGDGSTGTTDAGPGTTAAPTSSGAATTEAPTTAGPTTAGPTTAAPTSGSGGETTGAVDACTPEACVGPVELFQPGDPGTPSGFVRCASGMVHRVAAVACAQVPGDCAEPLEGDCQVDADCPGPFGACVADSVCGEKSPGCSCASGCAQDSDCPEGQVCLCAAPGLAERSFCVPAGCTSDADCGGQACAGVPDGVGLGTVQALACHAAGDPCCGDADCDVGNDCLFEGAAWSCQFPADCGRPLLVDGAPALADAAARADWRDEVAAAAAVPAALRGRLAAHWSRTALAEHASVGSFARFILQLLALGAPAALLSAAQAALADEVAHARACFALASAYAGAEVGPGPLPAACAPVATDRAAAVLAAIDEACVGETLSALEVAEAAARAEDPRLRALLRTIADDEARHAALGWAFVRWALDGADAALRARAADRFAAALARAAAPAPADDPALRAFGVVDPGLRARLVRRGLAEVVSPCAAALLAA
jgi:hypothetical protein